MSDLASAISGSWYNELASQLLLEADGSGRLSGSLRSGVGEGPDHYPLTGFYSPAPDGRGATLAFVVHWSNLHSLTAWAGHFHRDAEIMTATWLLTGASDEWRSTNVGYDRFSRTPIANERKKAGTGSSVPHVMARMTP